MAELIFLIIGYRLGYFSEVKAKCKINKNAVPPANYTNICTKVKPKNHHAIDREHTLVLNPLSDIFGYQDGQKPLKQVDLEDGLALSRCKGFISADAIKADYLNTAQPSS
ncbi:MULTISPECIES: hypothetical protein [unclassified Acinetobacter]|uniref:hypothetical protein n=1 Tax=unclassified Acinetobacter TaxID=196816 RepID=UPI0015D38DCE|nr:MULTISPECIES: hypothetical protein [unclassified Acinetobacter]